MARRTGKGRNGGRFSILRHDIARSTAYRSLTTNARAVYIEILIRYNGHNNGEVPLACREAGILCGISKSTAMRALKELVNVGLIKIGEDASFNMKKRTARRWILTQFELDGKSPTNEWRQFKPEE